MSLFYEIQGAGEPLLLLPGFACGAWNWFRQLDAFARDFTVISFDPRGIGRSRSAEKLEYSMASFADDAALLLDRAGFESAHILGASFGGFVAQEFALRFPDRVNRLILACTTAGGAQHVRADMEILQSFSPDPSMEIGERIRRFIRPAFSDEFNRDYPEIVESVCRMREENVVEDSAYMGQLTSAFAFDVSARLGDIHAETLVMSGDRDRIVPVENSHFLATKLPHAELDIERGGSHMFFIENAARFNSRVTAFLKRD